MNHEQNGPEADAFERKLVGLLRDLPAPAPGEGFERRVLEPALARLPRRRAWPLAAGGMALAASVLVAMVALHRGPAPIPDVAEPTVQFALISVNPAEVRMVDVLLQADTAVEAAMLTVELDERLGLESHPGVQKLSWQTSLNAGANKLSLPVRLYGPGSGTLAITLKHDGTERRMIVRVAATSS